MKFLLFLFLLLSDVSGWTTEMNITGVSDIDAAIPEFWADGILTDGDRESFWGQLSGKEGDRTPMVSKTGKLSEKGDKLTFNTIAQLMGSGVTGESVLKGQEEKLSIGTFTVSADVVRHAVAVNRKGNKQANFDQVKTAKMLLKDWMTRYLDDNAFSTLLSGSTNTLYGGVGSTAVTDLTSNSTALGPYEVEMVNQALRRQGAIPIRVSKVNGRTVPVYGMVFGEVEEFNLMQNSSFVNTLKETLDRYRQSNDHPLFNTALGMYRNMILYPYSSINPLPQGTPLRPETIVGVTLATAATTLTCSETTTDNYTKFFSSTGTLLIGSEQITYTGKTANTFTGLTRAANSTSAIQHSVDAKVTQNNVASVIGFGAEAIFRAMPENVEAIGDKDDYDEHIGLGVRCYMGDAVRKDARLSTSLNSVVLKVYSKLQGTV